MTGGVAVVLGPTGRNVAAGMSGGIGVLPRSRPRPAEHRDGGRARADRGGPGDHHGPGHPAPRGDRVRRSPPVCWPTGTTSTERFTKVLPRDYARVLAARELAESRGSRRGDDDHAHDGGRSWLTPRVHDDAAAGRRAATGGGADPRLERGLSGVAGAGAAADHLRAGRPLHGLRHPVLPHRLPVGEPDPGVERPGLAQRLGRGAGAAARDQQLPGVHRPAVSRPRARPPAWWGSTATR